MGLERHLQKRYVRLEATFLLGKRRDDLTESEQRRVDLGALRERLARRACTTSATPPHRHTHTRARRELEIPAFTEAHEMTSAPRG